MNKPFCSREGKGKCLPLEERPLTGDRRSHPGELPVRFHRDADKLQLLEGCSAEQMVFLSVVLGCCDVCSSL